MGTNNYLFRLVNILKTFILFWEHFSHDLSVTAEPLYVGGSSGMSSALHIKVLRVFGQAIGASPY